MALSALWRKALSLIRLNGYSVRSMVLQFPLRGRWTARLEVNELEENLVSKPCVLEEDNGSRLICNVVSQRSGSDVVYVAGGSSGLRNEASAKSFKDATVKAILSDTLGNIQLSKTSPPGVMNTRLPFWTRLRSYVSRALDDLGDSVKANWRVLDDGSVWFGAESYPKLDDFSATVMDMNGADETLLVAPDDIRLRPGFTWRGHEVGEVEHAFNRNEPLRTTIWLSP